MKQSTILFVFFACLFNLTSTFAQYSGCECSTCLCQNGKLPPPSSSKCYMYELCQQWTCTCPKAPRSLTCRTCTCGSTRPDDNNWSKGYQCNCAGCS